MTSNNIFSPEESILLQTMKGKHTKRPPFWFMRQAGRVLPSYMAIREKYSFWEMMQKPDLGAEITLLPVKDLQVDAAILFSDILVIPFAMGMGLEFSDHGPVFEFPLAGRKNPVNHLKPDASKLNYIYEVIDRVVELRPSNTPLIGFCGAPLTVLCYMLEGISRNYQFPEATQFIYENKQETKKLVDAITELTIEYALEQIKHKVDVFQLFESHAGLIPLELYNELFMPSVKKISEAIRQKGIPFIYFPKGFGLGIESVSPDICDYMSIDWQIPIHTARKLVHPEIGLQGNLDPRILYSNQKEIEHQLNKYIQFGKENQNWIFNLGHGFTPGIPYENAKFLADWIRNVDWGRL